MVPAKRSAILLPLLVLVLAILGCLVAEDQDQPDQTAEAGWLATEAYLDLKGNAEALGMSVDQYLLFLEQGTALPPLPSSPPMPTDPPVAPSRPDNLLFAFGFLDPAGDLIDCDSGQAVEAPQGDLVQVSFVYDPDDPQGAFRAYTQMVERPGLDQIFDYFLVWNFYGASNLSYLWSQYDGSVMSGRMDPDTWNIIPSQTEVLFDPETGLFEIRVPRSELPAIPFEFWDLEIQHRAREGTKPFCDGAWGDDEPMLIFSDGFESGDTSAWSQ